MLILYSRYVARILAGLVVYDIQIRAIGFGGALRRLSALKVRKPKAEGNPVATIGRALNAAIALYPGKVMCLQRSVVATRILRKSGIAAYLVIGYRPTPFFSHSWVEVDDRVVYDQASYRNQLRLLLRSAPPQPLSPCNSDIPVRKFI